MSEKKFESLEKEYATLEEEFDAIEREIVANFTSEDIQDINDTLISEKAEYAEGLIKRDKSIINLLILGSLMALGLFSGIILNMIICIPLIGVFIYKLIKFKKLLEDIRVSYIIIGSLLYTKKEYMERFE